MKRYEIKTYKNPESKLEAIMRTKNRLWTFQEWNALLKEFCGTKAPREVEANVSTVLELEPWMLFEKDWCKDMPAYWNLKAMYTFLHYKDMYIRAH